MMTDLFDTCLAIQCGAISQQQAGMEQLSECANAGQVGTRVPWDPACAQFNETLLGPVPVPMDKLVQPNQISPTMVSHSPGFSAQDLLLVLPNMPNNVRPPSTGPGSPCEGGYGVGVEDKEAGIHGWGGVQGPIAEPSLVCRVGEWAADNPWLAGLALIGVWWVAGGKTKRQGR